MVYITPYTVGEYEQTVNKTGKSYRTNTVDGRGGGWDNEDRPERPRKEKKVMEKGRGKGKDTLQTDNVFTREEGE